jgi:hypothetical protein
MVDDGINNVLWLSCPVVMAVECSQINRVTSRVSKRLDFILKTNKKGKGGYTSKTGINVSERDVGNRIS